MGLLVTDQHIVELPHPRQPRRGQGCEGAAGIDGAEGRGKAEAFGEENMRNIEKQLLLQAIDTKWRDHLLTLEHLRSVVGFRGYAQRDPLNEYKNCLLYTSDAADE